MAATVGALSSAITGAGVEPKACATLLVSTTGNVTDAVDKDVTGDRPQAWSTQ